MTKYTNHTQNTTMCLTSFVKKKKKKSQTWLVGSYIWLFLVRRKIRLTWFFLVTKVKFFVPFIFYFVFKGPSSRRRKKCFQFSYFSPLKLTGYWLPFSPDIVEAMAAARAISFAQELGIRPFILEGDSEAVIKTFMAAEDSLSSFGHIISLAKTTLVTNECISFSHT